MIDLNAYIKYYKEQDFTNRPQATLYDIVEFNDLYKHFVLHGETVYRTTNAIVAEHCKAYFNVKPLSIGFEISTEE